MSLIIVPATITDSFAITTLCQESLGYTTNTEIVKQQLSQLLNHPQHCLLVAKDNHVVLGFIHACYYQSIYQPIQIEIVSLAVNPNTQGKGVGKQLLAAIEQWAQDQNITTIRLISGVERLGAHQFYEACGYILRKQHKNYYKIIKENNNEHNLD